DDERELDLVVDAARRARNDDRLAGPDDRARQLGKDERLLRALPGRRQLVDVVLVVDADEDELAGARERRQQPGARGRPAAGLRLGDPAGRRAVSEQLDEVAAAETAPARRALQVELALAVDAVGLDAHCGSTVRASDARIQRLRARHGSGRANGPL